MIHLRLLVKMKIKNLITCFYSFGVILIFSYLKEENTNRMTDNLNEFNTYLALGDSYTIGESVLLTESFPYQTVQMLRKEGFDFNAPEIIAKTGWTTDELQAAIDTHKFQPPYNFVSLLIGVNNHYRGWSIENYKPEFERLLEQAISFAGGKPNHVFVLSIPDWGVTPFAEGRNSQQIAVEIDQYNKANKAIAEKYAVNYVDITQGSREALHNKELLASDGLHPSAKEYTRWANKIVESIKMQIR